MKLTVPLFVTGRVSKTMLDTVIVVPLGMVSAPPPPIVPALQVIDVPVRLIGSVPFTVPPDIASVVILSALAPFRVIVPLLAARLDSAAMLLSVFVPPACVCVPVTLYEPLIVVVPLAK